GAARGNSRQMAERVSQLLERFQNANDPRITSGFLGWLEAPPIRSTSTQPMWVEVFELLLEQGDPRTPVTLERLKGHDFPSGKTKQTWMAERIAAEHQRWLARDDAEQPLSLSEPCAELGLATPRAFLSPCVALLCGDTFVEAGGQEVAPTVDPLATAALFVTEVWWDGHHRHTGYAAPAVPIV